MKDFGRKVESITNKLWQFERLGQLKPSIAADISGQVEKSIGTRNFQTIEEIMAFNLWIVRDFKRALRLTVEAIAQYYPMLFVDLYELQLSDARLC